MLNLSDSERIYTDVTSESLVGDHRLTEDVILARYGLTMTWDIKAGVMGKSEGIDDATVPS